MTPASPRDGPGDRSLETALPAVRSGDHRGGIGGSNRRPRRTRDRWRISARRATRGGATVTTRDGFCAEPCARTAPRFDRATRSESAGPPRARRALPPPPPTPTRPEKHRERGSFFPRGRKDRGGGGGPSDPPSIGSNEPKGASRGDPSVEHLAGRGGGSTSRGGGESGATRGGSGSRATRRRRWRGGRGWRRGASGERTRG